MGQIPVVIKKCGKRSPKSQVKVWTKVRKRLVKMLATDHNVGTEMAPTSDQFQADVGDIGLPDKLTLS